ncbi:MAG: hypothetical protein A4E71_00138 [Smithella sp. PtaU1.Bin162]|nr:MAG: hypothetical protein A4E71_00138 [Smithella sp. PtaU1.Bin162]
MIEKIEDLSEIKIDSNGRLLLRNLAIGWAVELQTPRGGQKVIIPEDMYSFKKDAKDGQLQCRWNGCGELGDSFEVVTLWKLHEGLLSGKISWNGACNGSCYIENIVFPEASMPLYSSSNLLLPVKQGIVMHDIKNHIYNNENPNLIYQSPFQQMQFCSCCSSYKSYYFDCRDTDFFQKSFQFIRDKGRKRIMFRGIYHLPLASEYTSIGKIPYPLTIGVFRGGWFEACQIYRGWALKQTWANRSARNLEQIREIAIWIWNRGYKKEVVPPVIKLQKDIGLPVALDWYWWHKHGYDTLYPSYWPPREGAAHFRRTIKELNMQGIFTQVYTNGLVWDMGTQGWKDGGHKEAVIQRNGQIKAAQFNVFTGSSLAWICGGAINIFGKKLKYIASRLASCKISSLYLDMIGCETYDCCYSHKHSHISGGGNYQAKGFKKILTEIRKKNPELLLSTEYGSENYMNEFDIAISLSPSMERLGMEWPSEFVPAFTAVYHEKFPVFGNYAMPDSIPPVDPLWPKSAAWKKEKKWNKLYPDQFCLEMARTLIWGYQPTVCNLRNSHLDSNEFRIIYSFICKTACFYYKNREFLFDGEMLPFGKMEVKKTKVKFLSRFIFTREGEQKVIEKEFPVLLHSLWRSPDGRIGLIAANYTKSKRFFKFTGSYGNTRGCVMPRSYKLFILKKHN